MTKEQIVQAAKIAEGECKIYLFETAFRDGAEWMQKQQPYNAKDIQNFWIWTFKAGWWYGSDGFWHNEDTEVYSEVSYTIEKVLQIQEARK